MSQEWKVRFEYTIYETLPERPGAIDKPPLAFASLEATLPFVPFIGLRIDGVAFASRQAIDSVTWRGADELFVCHLTDLVASYDLPYRNLKGIAVDGGWTLREVMADGKSRRWEEPFMGKFEPSTTRGR